MGDKARASGKLSPSGARLKIIGPDMNPSVFPLTGEIVKIGRKRGVELQLEGRGISRVHAQIRHGATGWELMDLKSTNGTIINRKPVVAKILDHGDHIQMGDAEFIFELEDHPSPSSKPMEDEDPSFQLLGLSDNLKDRVFKLNPSITTLGRLESNDIQIDSETVSGFHAEIKNKFGQFVAKDLNSTNGTFVNGRQIEEYSLSPGDILAINTWQFKVEAGDPRMDTTGTVIHHANDGGLPLQHALKELEPIKDRPSYQKLKRTSLFGNQLGDPTLNHDINTPPPGPTSRNGFKKFAIALVLITLAFMAVGFYLFRTINQQKASLESSNLELKADLEREKLAFQTQIGQLRQDQEELRLNQEENLRKARELESEKLKLKSSMNELQSFKKSQEIKTSQLEERTQSGQALKQRLETIEQELAKLYGTNEQLAAQLEKPVFPTRPVHVTSQNIQFQLQIPEAWTAITPHEDGLFKAGPHSTQDGVSLAPAVAVSLHHEDIPADPGSLAPSLLAAWTHGETETTHHENLELGESRVAVFNFIWEGEEHRGFLAFRNLESQNFAVLGLALKKDFGNWYPYFDHLLTSMVAVE